MKKIIYILIIFFSGVIGFEIKRKYVEQRNLLVFLKSLFEYMLLNISFYRNNTHEIINNYLIMQKNKNAKYAKLFKKNDNFIVFNKEYFKNYNYKKELNEPIISYFNNLGIANIDLECANLKKMISYTDDNILKLNEEIKVKGDLYFKISLALGIVLVIMLW